MSKSRGLSGQHESTPAVTELPHVNLDAKIYGIGWPANRLTYGQLRTLRQISKDVRVPITQLLKDAVDVYLSLIQREMQAAMVAEQETGREPDDTEVPDEEESTADSEPATLDHAANASNENSPIGRMSPSGCHVDRRMIAEFENSSETDHLVRMNLPSEPKTQLGFIFSED